MRDRREARAGTAAGKVCVKKAMEFEQLLQLVESNAKSIEALSNESANARQELKETRAIADSNAKAILGLADEAKSSRQDIRDLKETSLILRDSITGFLQIASDHEKRLTQLVGYLITGESDRLDLLERLQKVERRIDGLEKG